jgi:hypothetical protein
MAQTLTVPEMLPAKFTPTFKRHFVFAIEGIDAFLIKTASKPEMKTEEQTIHWINSKRYVAGVTTFEPINVTLHDPQAPSAAQQVMEWVRLHYESVSGRAGYADFYKRDIQFKQLDPVGTVIQLWDIKGAFITSAKFGEVTYEGSDMMEIALTLRYDNAVMQY